jgi:hypothetical protein
LGASYILQWMRATYSSMLQQSVHCNLVICRPLVGPMTRKQLLCEGSVLVCKSLMTLFPSKLVPCVLSALFVTVIPALNVFDALTFNTLTCIVFVVRGGSI